jgi:hypothetical protein
MRIHKFIMAFILVGLSILTGCSGGLGDAQKIKVQILVGEEMEYEDLTIVTDQKQVLKVKEILMDTQWEKSKVDMIRPPDYQFVFQFKNPNIEAKAVLHQVWISPNKDKLEIVQGNTQYAQLTKESSGILFEIITGDKLAD